jgi:ABC-2 type transport system permease protein
MLMMLFRKWRALFAIYAQEGLAYRANGFIWILTDAVPAMVMPMVFIASSKQNGVVAGLTSAQFVQYYLTMLLLTNFIISHLMWELAQEIKDGIFTMSLLRPVAYFQVCFIRNLTWRVLRLFYFLPLLAVMLLLYRGFLPEEHFHFGWEVIAAVFLGHLVSFTVVYMMSMLALFFQETFSIFGLYYFPMLFLSGQLFPIYLMPSWIVGVAKFLPFYYTTAFPVDLIMGRVALSSAPSLMLVQLAWIAVHLAIARILWHFGLRHYTAVGM